MANRAINSVVAESVELLEQLIATPSFSREENSAADLVERFLQRHTSGEVKRLHNNVYVHASNFDPSLPTLLINSHLDTVRPVASYQRDPFAPTREEGRLYGLGSNDAGASVVALIAAYRCLEQKRLPYNLLLALSAEEEVMGEHGMRALLSALQAEFGQIDMALVGEPTGMRAAVGERGLVVMDCVARGVSGHAAREEGVNAIDKAMEDIKRLKKFRFERTSDLLGEIKMTVTQIQAGTQHNVIPDECRFVIDIRTTDAYSNEQTVKIVQELLTSEAKERSTRVHASAIAPNHPLVEAAAAVGCEMFISPTTSDMAILYDIPSLKMGPGDSARSHKADEYILLNEIEEAVALYLQFLEALRV